MVKNAFDIKMGNIYGNSKPKDNLLQVAKEQPS